MALASRCETVNIRFVSSLTPDDENAVAPALLKAFAAMLDQLPIAYTLRIETTGTQVYQHSHPTLDDALGHAAAESAPIRLSTSA